MPDAFTDQALPPGTRLKEFTIERVLGSGGFGITYLALDRSLGRTVVVKENLPAQFAYRDPSSLTVSPRHSKGPDAESFAYSLESFAKEAETLASLDHPGIVRILRSWEANGTAYFAMPFVEGEPLDEQIRYRAGKGRRFDEEEIGGLLWWLLDALDYLHDRGIYHRDIKPSNILIGDDGDPVLIDFGAARQRLSERSMTVFESIGYTPFEQMQSRGEVGPWSDLYALGATLFRMVTGEQPDRSTDRILEDAVPSLAGRADLAGLYSPELLETIDRAMSPGVAGRWRSAGEWREALWSGQTEAPIEAGRRGEVRRYGGIEMVWCPPGAFEAGAPEASDRPAGAATGRFAVGEGFWMARTPCTQGQWQRIMDGNPSRFGGGLIDRLVALLGGGTLRRREDLPVEGVAWEDAHAWLARMNERHPLPAGWVWALPNEIEWEYACRAGASGGEDAVDAETLGEFAWYRGNARGRTRRVGRKRPNPWGLHDMLGNVWEWCETVAEEDGDDGGEGEGEGEGGPGCVARGGAWLCGAEDCRPSSRLEVSPAIRSEYLGFRPVAIPG